MIKKTVNKNELDCHFESDIFLVRIMSLLEAYGTKYDFASFYKQVDVTGKTTALISKLDNDYTLCIGDNADLDELKEFFMTVGYNSVLSGDNFYINDSFEQGVIMKSTKRTEYHINNTETDSYPRLMDIFNFDDYNTLDFESWYVDLSHRIRHGCSRAYTLCQNGEIVSSAIFSSIWNDDAVLTAVSTLPKYRKNGFATALLSEMMWDIKGDIYLMREENKNEQFYKRLGFENIGNWRMYK